MKLQLDKFLTLTAMMATAQLGLTACVADDADEAGQSVNAGDDAGADDDEGASDDDSGDDDSADDDTGDDDSADDDVAAEGDDAGADDDVPAEDGDAGADDDVDGDAGADDDAGSEGEVWTDAGGEGEVWSDAGGETLPPEGDAGGEAVECLGGSDPAMEAFDCYYMFSACPGTYGAVECESVASSRTAAVYGAFLDCVNAAGVEDPCSEAGDVAVFDCAAAADAMACVEADDGCAAAGELCSEIDVAGCDATVAPLHATKRADVFACFDYYYTSYAETYGPDYEGCSYDYEICLVGGPSGE